MEKAGREGTTGIHFPKIPILGWGEGEEEEEKEDWGQGR
jgi:hypothetical protein